MVSKQPGHGRPVGDIRADDRDTSVFTRSLELQQTAGIGQLVDDDEAIVGVIEDVMDEIRSDETGAPGEQKSRHGSARQTAAPSGYCSASRSSLANESTVVPVRFHAPSVSKRKSP